MVNTPPQRIMILVALSRKQACRKGSICLQGLCREVQADILAFAAGKLSYLRPFSSPMTACPAYSGEGGVSWRKWGDDGHRGRKQRPSFSNLVTDSDWARVSQEMWVSLSGSRLRGGEDNQHMLAGDWLFPFVVRRELWPALAPFPTTGESSGCIEHPSEQMIACSPSCIP